MNLHIKLTVFFEGIFWVGVFERIHGDNYEAARVVFGEEPKDYEIYDFILNNFYTIKFSASFPEEAEVEKKINPKRMLREIKKEIQNRGIGTKAQQAMQLQYEAMKTERKKYSKEQKEAELERQFQIRQQNKKEKHKGH